MIRSKSKGKKSVPRIGIHDPWITECEFRHVREALASNWISGGGAKVAAFESALGEFLGLAHPPVATVNGSAALVLGLRVGGLRAGEHMLVSDYGFVATANAVRQLGAEPILVGPGDAELPVVRFKQIERFFAEEVDDAGNFRRTCRPVRGVLYNEPYGLACPDLARIAELCERRGLLFIEDASQAIGVAQSGRMLGTFGDLGVFSFNGNKTLTTGAGGLLMGHRPEWLARARKLQAQARSDDFDFFYDEPGYNFLLSNLLGAFGLAQTERLPEILARKRALREHYREALTGSGWCLLGEEHVMPAWLNVAVAPEARPREWFRALAARLGDRGVQVRPAFPPVSANPMFQGCTRIDGEHTNHLFARGLCLPSGAALGAEEARFVVEALAQEGRNLG